MSYTKTRGGFLKDNDGYINVWIDGSCLRNGQPGARAGYGVFYNFNHRMNVSAPVKGRATNNAGEIQGAIRAIRDSSRQTIKNLVINTDSDFLFVSVTKRLYNWRRNNFCKANGEPLANRTDFIKLNKALQTNKKDMKIKFKHVSAHSGDAYNDEADKLAKEGARKYQPDD